MAIIKIYDRADEFRIEIIGKFEGESVQHVGATWRNALDEYMPRRFKVDVSGLSAYDTAGRKLLREMYRHGMQFAAGTPLALVFLKEISTPLRRVPAGQAPGTDRKDEQIHVVTRAHSAAAGQ